MSRPIALVFSMHKVGSSCVMQAFRSIGRLPERGYAENLDNYLRPLSKYEKTVTMVRDPIARNISRLFNLHGEALINVLPEMIALHFVEQFDDHDYPLRWFDTYFKPDFVDVYSKPFNKKRGWDVYGDILVIRTENLDSGLRNGIIQLFDLPEDTRVEVDRRANSTTRKDYGKSYKDFIDYIGFDDAFLNRMYDNQYMQHFYSPKQIEGFRKRWAKKK